MSDLLTLKNIICLIVLFISVASVYLPHWIIDTSNCKRNWVVILVILTCLLLIINKNMLATLIICILLVAIIVDYLYKRYNRTKSHERTC